MPLQHLRLCLDTRPKLFGFPGIAIRLSERLQVDSAEKAVRIYVGEDIQAETMTDGQAPPARRAYSTFPASGTSQAIAAGLAAMVDIRE